MSETPSQWKEGLLTSIYKKGNKSQPQNYRPTCMLACSMKIIEASIAARRVKQLPICGLQFGFQKGLSSAITLTEVDALIRGGQYRIATLDLTKAYDRFNRQPLLDNCGERLDARMSAMLTACMQVLRVSTKCDVQGTTAEIRLGLTQGAPLSPILFLIYIDDLPRFCRRETR